MTRPDRALDRRFPDAAAMEAAGLPRIPRFVADYLTGGIGDEAGLRRNRETLSAVTLLPRYLVSDSEPELAVTVAGAEWAAPFGVAPLGLGGLIWPYCETDIARAAAAAGIGHVLSTYATAGMETIGPIAGRGAAFQLYPPNVPEIEEDMIDRAKAAGYRVLVVTIDIPGATRRRRDMMNGLSVPPVFYPRTLAGIARCPRWALSMARKGVPDFESFSPYYPKGSGVGAAAAFIEKIRGGHIGPDWLARIRSLWPGPMIVKGILSADDAAEAMALGADGIVVSNHGARQLDAAPAAPEVLPAIRARLGDETLILADGGVRSGLDIARMIALGADAVLIGRPFLHAAAAMGRRGPAHLIAVLTAELTTAMIQLGCTRLSELRGRLWRGEGWR